MKKILLILLAVTSLSTYALSSDDLANVSSDNDVSAVQNSCNSLPIRHCTELSNPSVCRHHYENDPGANDDKYNCVWHYGNNGSGCSASGHACNKNANSAISEENKGKGSE